MIILEKPYISDFLKETVIRLQTPVLKNGIIENDPSANRMNLIQEEEFIQKINEQDYPVLYTNSENTINWINRKLPKSHLTKTIRLLKDKYSFRRLIGTLYPGFYFNIVEEKALDSLDVRSIPKPFVIKPAVGFVSMGVYTVYRDDDWPGIVRSIRDEITATHNMYPSEVINTEKFLIEERIQGDEFAIDAYFDEYGEAVVLNIMKHLFSSKTVLHS